MANIERALAHIEKIVSVYPIYGADNIERVYVLGWSCIAKKGEFKAGDLAVYIEIDSKCPDNDERFSFLAKKGYKVKTMKLGKFNVISQGLALPITMFPELMDKNIGDDVTNELHITYSNLEDGKRKKKYNPNDKYNTMAARHHKLFRKQPFRWLMKKNWGRKFLFTFFGKKKDNVKKFPDWIVRTDEVRCENIPWVLKENDKAYVVTEKIDGTSTTVAIDFTKKKKGDFIVCSRNVRQANEKQECYHTCGNVYWEMVGKYDLEKVVRDIAKEFNAKRIVLQGETYGDGIQGNPYKIKDRRFSAFNLVIDGERLPSIKAAQILRAHNVHFVPIVGDYYQIPIGTDMETFKLSADGFSEINPKVKREGFVYRSLDGKESFKNVSREFLLKHNG